MSRPLTLGSKMAPARQTRFTEEQERRIEALRACYSVRASGTHVETAAVIRQAVDLGLDVLEARLGATPEHP